MNSHAYSGVNEFEVSLENLVAATVGTHNLKTPAVAATVVHLPGRRLRRARRAVRTAARRIQGVMRTRPKARRDSM